MTGQEFSTGEAWSFGWKHVKKNFWFFAGVLFLAFGISLMFSLTQELAMEAHPLFSGLLSLVYFVFAIFLNIGIIKVFLRFLTEEKGRFSDLWTGSRYFFKYLFVELIMMGMVLGVWLAAGLLIFLTLRLSQGVAMWAGVVLLGLLAVAWLSIVSIRLQFASYLVVDKGMGPIKALKQSWPITRGQFWHLFVFGLAMVFINLLGLLALVVGILFTWPATMLAYAYVYRKLAPLSPETV